MEEINKKYAEILELKAYLTATDYNILKWKEGYEIDAEILSNRVEARDRINALKDEIEVLQSELEQQTNDIEIL